MDWLVAFLVLAIIAETAVFVYLLRQPAPKPNHDHLSQTIDVLSRQVHELATQAAVSRGELQKLDARQYAAVRLLQELKDGNMKLIVQIVEEFGGIPVWEPPSDSELELLTGTTRKKPLQPKREIPPELKLTRLFGEYFSEDGLRGVCLEMGVDFENLPGRMKQAKAQSLVHWANNRNRLQELADIGQKERPFLDWEI